MTEPPTLETAVVTALVRHAAPRSRSFALADVVNGVIALHRRAECATRPQAGHCAACNDGDDCVPWPCDTVKVVATGLGMKEGDWR